MAHFLKHEPCPSCGSRDNLGRYSDGSAFCFGCGYTERASMSPFVGERNGKSEKQSIRTDGTTTEFPEHVVQWFGKYGISIPQILAAGIGYSVARDSVVFPFYDQEGNLVCIQERNFNPKRAAKAKYYNRGEKGESFTIYGKQSVNAIQSRGNGYLSRGGLHHGNPTVPLPQGDVVVLTEDVLSALKISPYKDAMPLLGTHISRNKLSWLKQRYRGLQVWLDRDKWKEAVNIANAAKFMGLSARAIYSELDPKEYSLETIKEYLK